MSSPAPSQPLRRNYRRISGSYQIASGELSGSGTPHLEARRAAPSAAACSNACRPGRAVPRRLPASACRDPPPRGRPLRPARSSGRGIASSPPPAGRQHGLGKSGDARSARPPAPRPPRPPVPQSPVPESLAPRSPDRPRDDDSRAARASAAAASGASTASPSSGAGCGAAGAPRRAAAPVQPRGPPRAPVRHGLRAGLRRDRSCCRRRGCRGRGGRIRRRRCRLPLRQVALLRAAFLDQLLQRADGLEEAVTTRRQDRRAGLVEDLPLHGQALDLRIGGGKEADAARFGGGDIFRTEVQETTLKLSQEGAAQTGSAQQMGIPTCGIQPHY